MFSKSVFVFAILAAAKLAVAIPPACLLGALMNNDDPSQVSTVCKNSKMPGYISDVCGDNTQIAMTAFANVCKEAGVKVASTVSSATGSSKSTLSTATHSGQSTLSTATYSGSADVTAAPSTSIVVYTTASFDSSCSCTKTGVVSSTAVVTPTGTGVAQATGAAGRMEMGAFVGMVGVVMGVFGVL